MKYRDQKAPEKNIKVLSQTSETLITVGITCFNAEQTIGRALRSALAQDWPNLEVIVVDDLSTDNSWNIINNIASTDSRVKAVRHSVNGGPAVTRNTILNLASGEFLIFFDDDDESMPERVKVQYNALCDYEHLNHTNLVACYASGIRLYPNGYALDIEAIGSKPFIPYGKSVADYLLFNGRKKYLFYGAGSPTCALFARVTTFKFLGGFDDNFRRVEDVDFAVRLALAGGHFIGCPEKLYVQYATTSSDKTPQKNLEAELQLVEKYSLYLTKIKRYGYARAWFKIRFYHFTRQRGKFFIALFYFLLKHPISGFKHLFESAPNRILHEKKMSRN